MREARLALFLIVLACTRVLAGETATAIATVAAGSVTGITVTSGGSGYSSAPAVTITGGSGTGATAVAVLIGDKVAQVIVSTAGSGYIDSPLVTIAPPPSLLGIRPGTAPKLALNGPPGGLVRLEWSNDLGGPWNAWTNVIVGPGEEALLDLAPFDGDRFYRAILPQRNPWGFASGNFTWSEALADAARRNVSLALWGNAKELGELQGLAKQFGIRGWANITWSCDFHGQCAWSYATGPQSFDWYRSEPALPAGSAGLSISISGDSLDPNGPADRQGYFYRLP